MTEHRGALPPFPVRLVQLFTAPSRLFDSLKEQPAWVVALLVGAVAVGVGVIVIPAEVWSEMARAQLVAAGQEVPAEIGGLGKMIRYGAAIAGVFGWVIATLVVAAVLTGVFGFVLGDQVSFRQLLSAYSHASLVGAVGVLLVAPLRIMQGNPQLTLSLGSFAPGLGGFAGAFLGGLDLFSLWTYFLVGLAITRFDPRRSLGTAVGITMGIAVVVVAVGAFFARGA